MAGPTVAQKKISDYVPDLKKEGVPYVAAAAKGGVAIQTKKVTLTGATHTIVFEDIGLSDMADTSYSIHLDGETAARITPDESTITVAGFDILGGAAAEVAHLTIVGRLKNQGV